VLEQEVMETPRCEEVPVEETKTRQAAEDGHDRSAEAAPKDTRSRRSKHRAPSSR